MKALFHILNQGGTAYMLRGLAHAMKSSGFEVHINDAIHSQIAPLDLLNKIEPDILVSSSYPDILTRALKKGIIARPNMKVVLYAKAHPNSYAGKFSAKHPEIQFDVADQNDLRNIDDVAQHIDLMFVHHLQEVSERWMDGWENHCKKWTGIGNAFDAVAYANGGPDPLLQCEIGYLGGYWSNKGHNLAPWILPFTEPSSGFKTKIFGGGWATPACLGYLPEHLTRSFYMSAHINLNIHEPHSTHPELGCDIVERPYKVLGCGGFLISDYVKELNTVAYNSNEIVVATSPEDMMDKARYYLKEENNDERLEYMQRGQKATLGRHTYFDRAAQMLKELGLENESMKIMMTKTMAVNHD